jgi:uncharacterized membrane protein
MTTDEFLSELKKELEILPQDEAREALSYYENYIKDSGEEETTVASLGSPRGVAAQIIAEFVAKGGNVVKPEPKTSGGSEKPKDSARTLFTVIALIFAAPIALPLAIAAAAVIFSVAIAIFAIYFSFFITGIALFATGIVNLIVGFAVIITHPASSAFLLGAGLICLGVGYLVTMLCKYLIKISIRGLSKLTARFILRRSSK